MTNFPQYRKYSGHKTWFKIVSETEMQELKVLGEFYNHTTFKATTFVDRNLISDMISNYGNHWEIITEYEFNRILENCKNNLQVNPSL
jgi:hypothetical protein